MIGGVFLVSEKKPSGWSNCVVSLPTDFYDRLCYVADYFGWPVNRTAAWMVMKSVSGVHFGEDLNIADWRDPRFKMKK